MTTTGPTTNAGWYPDPTTPGRIRYWDGKVWTEHSLEAPPAQSTARLGQAGDSATTTRPWWRRWWVITIAAVVVLMIIGSLTPGSGDDKKPASPPQAAAPTQSAAATHSASPKVHAAKVKQATVPMLAGMSLGEARQTLRSHHLLGGYIERRPSALPPGTVLSQGFRGGKKVLLGTGIPLVIAAPLPRVPAVVGQSASAAVQVLRGAGFRTHTIRKTTTSGSNGVVLSQSPLSGLPVRPHAVVTIVVAHVVLPVTPTPTQTAAPTPTQNCTPGYSPCLPPAYDYDCAGGSGDGPKYVSGTVRVTGSDPYDLDADGDGYGCD
ncbi:MAG TPA: PASTA domain-containing protein [Nocardioides sp.]|uniref:PASTA domain-containing protein n=1 Tax=Nocardioides sp. TaxID=35761 RepID=UPI002F3FEC05